MATAWQESFADHAHPDCAVADMQMLLEATGVGTWSYDSATHELRLDKVCREMFDLAEDEVLDMDNLRRRMHPDDVDRYWRAVNESLRTGTMSVSYRIVRKDGTVRFISGRARTTAGGSDAGPVQVRGICIDITDRYELQTRLRRTELRMQHLADSVPGFFSFIDRDYRIVFMSSHYRESLGLSQEEVLGHHMAELVGQAEFESRRANYDAALAGRTVIHEACREIPDGETRYYVVTHKPYRDDNGEIYGVMNLAVDITDRHRFEEELRSKSAELERSNRDLEQFAYVASHDLKAPLRAIDVLVQWLQEDLQDYEGGDVRDNLALLRARAQRLNRLLDDLLEYSRVGRRVGERRHVVSSELVQDIAALLAPPPGMRVEADASLPVLETYRAPLEQVLRNLINNAVKHHPTGEGRVVVSAAEQDDAVLFAVTDDGAGIPPAYADKVFQMFQTLQPRDEREGSGMGLAIVKRIIDWQGGRVWFHPGPGGKGTVFKFTWNKQPALPGAGTGQFEEASCDTQPRAAAGEHPAG